MNIDFSWTECGITICVLVVLAAVCSTIQRRPQNRRIAMPAPSDKCKRSSTEAVP